MPTNAEDSGFLSRWSRRKALVRQGAALEPPAEASAAVVEKPVLVASPAVAAAVPAIAPAQAEPAQTSTPAPQPDAAPLPTLADVAALTRDSDYSRFVANTVQPDVKNAALAKLFTDPHFNVMDGLDTYIDDYGKPDPLPPGMLRQMLQAHVLGLFDEEDEKAKAKTEAAASEPLANATEAQPPCAAAPTTDPASDENTDLQLQPDHGAGRTGAVQQALAKTPGAQTDGLDSTSTRCCAGAKRRPFNVPPRPPAPVAMNCWWPARRKAACSWS